jgi:hypothetical protein
VTHPQRRTPAVLALASCCALVAATLVDTPDARSRPTRWAWPYMTLIERIAGTRVSMRRGSVRIDRDLVICNGEGPPVRRGGVRRWNEFTCTQTLFDRGGIGRDVTFRVRVLDRARFRITAARYGPV